MTPAGTLLATFLGMMTRSDLTDALRSIANDLDAAEDFVASAEFGDLPVADRVKGHRRVAELTAEWNYVEALRDATPARRAA